MQNPPPNPPNQPPYGQQPGYGQQPSPPPPGGYGMPNQPPQGNFGGQQPPPPGYGVPNQPPPGYAPPPPGYGYPPPRRKGLPAWAWILIIVPILAVVACIAIVGLGVFAGFSVVNDGQKVYQNFLTASANGQVDQAYSLLSSDLQARISKEDFKTQFVDKAKEFDGLTSLDVSSFNAATVNGRSTLIFSGTAKFKSRDSTQYSVSLSGGTGSWVIEGFSIGSYTLGVTG